MKNKAKVNKKRSDKYYMEVLMRYYNLIMVAIALGFILCGCADHLNLQGPKGDPGKDADPIKVVQLCPGSSNYGVFIEVAICQNNQLWGVYSANGGFLTMLPPGRYSSNGIGSACNFTVLDNCQVIP